MMDLFIFLLLMVRGVASITLMRPNVLKLEVPSHIPPGTDLFHLNATSNAYRYLIDNGPDPEARKFFLANGQTLTTHQDLLLRPEANISLSILD